MEINTLLFIDLFILCAAFVFLKYSRTDFYSLNPVNIHLYIYFLYILTAQLLIVCYLLFLRDNKLLSLLVSYDSNNYWKINLLVMLCFLSFIIGIWFTNNFILTLKKSPKFKLDRHSLMKTVGKLKINFSIISMLFLFLLLFDFALIALFFKIFGMSLLSADVDDARYRIAASGGLMYMFMVYVYTNPFMAAILLGRILEGNSKIYVKILFLLSILLQSSSVLTGFRTYTFFYVMILIAIYTAYRPAIFKKQIVYFSLSALMVITITFLKYRDLVVNNPLIFFYKLFHRIVFDSSYALRTIFYIFDKENYLYGISYWWDLYSKLPGYQMTFQNYLSLKWGGTQYVIAIAATLPGELYANFGWFSIFIYFLFGCFINLSYVCLKKRMTQKNHILLLLLYAEIFVFSLRTVTVGFGGVYFLLIVATTLFFFIYCVYLILRSIQNSSMVTTFQNKL